MVVVGLGLSQRSLCSAELSLCVESCVPGFAAGLVLGFDGLADFELLALGGGGGGLLCSLKVFTLDYRNQLAGLYRVAFVHCERLDAARDFGADQDLIGVHRPDQLQIAGAMGGEEIPDEGTRRKNAEDEKDSITRVHLCLTSTLLFRTTEAGGLPIPAM
jgi:hypothetical protein